MCNDLWRITTLFLFFIFLRVEGECIILGIYILFEHILLSHKQYDSSVINRQHINLLKRIFQMCVFKALNLKVLEQFFNL